MKIKGFFKDKINVATFIATLILLILLTVYIATSQSKYVLEEKLSFNLDIVESEEWNKRILITGEELNQILIENEVLIESETTKVIFGYEDDYSDEVKDIEGIAVGLADTKKSFKAEDIKLYTVTDEETNITTAYILSDYQIKANADSSKMFYNYETLVDVNFSNIDTSIVENMSDMFNGCRNLVILDLYKFDTAKLKDISNMFYDCISLEKIYVSELWNLTEITDTQDNVFYNCEKLVGENGTAYNSSKISSDYAVIDDENNVGYFTYKSKDSIEVFTYNIEDSEEIETDEQNENTTSTNANPETKEQTNTINNVNTNTNTTSAGKNKVENNTVTNNTINNNITNNNTTNNETTYDVNNTNTSTSEDEIENNTTTNDIVDNSEATTNSNNDESTGEDTNEDIDSIEEQTPENTTVSEDTEETNDIS